MKNPKIEILAAKVWTAVIWNSLHQTSQSTREDPELMEDITMSTITTTPTTNPTTNTEMTITTHLMLKKKEIINSFGSQNIKFAASQEKPSRELISMELLLLSTVALMTTAKYFTKISQLELMKSHGKIS